MSVEPPALLENDRRLVRAGQVMLGDKDFTGRELEAFITGDFGAALIRPGREDENPCFGTFSGIRQGIECVFATLKGQLILERHGGRILAGVYARPLPDSSPSPPASGTIGKSTHPVGDP